MTRSSYRVFYSINSLRALIKAALPHGCCVFLIGLICCTCLSVPHANAAGFAIAETSAKELGASFAGGGAIAEEASAVWFNPAGITRLERSVQLAAHYIEPSFDFENLASGQQTPGGLIPLQPVDNTSSGGGKSAFVPNFYYVHPWSENLTLGLGLTGNYGLTTLYPDSWIGRYQTIESDIFTLNVNPSAGYQVNDQWSIGIGLNINYIDTTLTSAVDVAALCANAIGAACPNGAIPGQGQFDGLVTNAADDISIGYNVGVLWHANQQTRLSIAYRSELEHNAEGDVDFTEPDELGGYAALGPIGAGLAATLADGGITATVTLPDSFSASVFHPVTDTLDLMFDATWTDWSDLPELRINFDNPLTPTAVEELEWEAAWRFALGTQLQVNEKWAVRAGIALDQTPVPNAEVRTPRLPGNERRWLSLGASYKWSNHTDIDVGFLHVFVDDTRINRTGSTGSVLNGTYESDASVFSMQLRHRL